MRVAHFCAKYPYQAVKEDYLCGGSIHAARNLINELTSRGHTISVFTTSADHEGIEYQDGVRVNRYKTSFRAGSSNVSFGQMFKPKDDDYDLVHVHFDIPPAPFFGVRYGEKWDVPVVVTYHGDWITNFGSPLRRAAVSLSKSLVKSRILSPADAIISLSQSYIQESDNLQPYLGKISVIPNGIDIERFRWDLSKKRARETFAIPFDAKVILFHGYLYPHKGPDLLLKAMRRIKDRVPEAMLLCAGTGPMRPMLENLSMELGIESDVRFVGQVSDTDKPSLYAAADVFALPSQKECFPLVVLEAMATGLPIVASRVGGVPDLVHQGENGLLVGPSDIDGLSDGITALITDEQALKEMRETSIERSRSYSWSNVAKETEDLYNRVLEARGKR